MSTNKPLVMALASTAGQMSPVELIQYTRQWLMETYGGHWGMLWVAEQKINALEEEVEQLRSAIRQNDEELDDRLSRNAA